MKNVNDILDKYLAGESSLAEERELKRYFARFKNPPVGLEWAWLMFSGFGKAVKDTTPVRNLRRRYRRLIAMISVAAIVALAMTFTFTLPKSETIYCYVNGEPVTDLAVARRQAAMISRIAQTGEKVAISNLETIEQQATQSSAVDKAFKYLELIN